MAPARSTFRFRGKQRGTAATEFAILLPMLILFGLTTVDLGRFTSVAIAIDNAAHVGAERGSTRRYTTSSFASWKSDVEASVAAELADLNVNWITNLVVETTVSATDPATQLAWVTVVVKCNFNTIVAWPSIAQNVSIRRQVTMQQYR